jgi:hypothetical protein
MPKFPLTVPAAPGRRRSRPRPEPPRGPRTDCVPVHALPCSRHAPRSAPPAALRRRLRTSRSRVRSVVGSRRALLGAASGGSKRLAGRAFWGRERVADCNLRMDDRAGCVHRTARSRSVESQSARVTGRGRAGCTVGQQPTGRVATLPHAPRAQHSTKSVLRASPDCSIALQGGKWRLANRVPAATHSQLPRTAVARRPRPATMPVTLPSAHCDPGCGSGLPRCWPRSGWRWDWPGCSGPERSR